VDADHRSKSTRHRLCHSYCWGETSLGSWFGYLCHMGRNRCTSGDDSMKRLVIVIAISLIGLTACGNSYDYTGNAFQPTRPQLIGMQIKHDTVNAIGANCGIGVGVTGAGVLFTALAPPAGVAAWIVYGSYAATTAGAAWTLKDCWDEYNTNREWFEVYTQCQGEPVLTTTLSDFNEIKGVINFPSCKCRIICIYGGNNNPADPLFCGYELAFCPQGLGNAGIQWNLGKHFYHAGPNGLNRAETEPDWNAFAADLGLTYAGCDDTGGYNCTPRGPAGTPL
jgi:hypothetical protein